MSARQPYRPCQLQAGWRIAIGGVLVLGGLGFHDCRQASAAPTRRQRAAVATNAANDSQPSAAQPSAAQSSATPAQRAGTAASPTVRRASSAVDTSDLACRTPAAPGSTTTDGAPAVDACAAAPGSTGDATPKVDHTSTTEAVPVDADDHAEPSVDHTGSSENAATNDAAAPAAATETAAPKVTAPPPPHLRLGAELTSEYDSNVNLRDRDSAVAPVAAAALRAELAGAYGYQRHRHAFHAFALARLRAVDSALSEENVAWWQLHARYLQRIRQLQLGLVGQYTDSTGLVAAVGARTFRTLGALAEIRTATDADTFTIQAGWRTFTYWPDAALTYQAPSFAATWQRRLNRAGTSHELALHSSLGAEGRTFASHAWVALCAAPTCLVQTNLARQDLVARAAVELAYTQRAIWSVGYRYLGIASNSAGQSVQRHVLVATTTRALAPRLVGSAQVTLQLTQGAAAAGVATELLTLADESRSALLLRLGYQLTATWTLEARTQGWVTLDSADYQRVAFALAMVRNAPPH